MRDAIAVYLYHRRLGFGRFKALSRAVWCWL
jgi:hypothetical protein